MNYRMLGRSGLRISEIGLGSWLTYGNVVEKRQATACINTAYDQGITLFDTADVYNQGAAESFLGEALQSFRRADLVLATKCFFPMSANPNDQGLSRKHIIESAHASLRRLKTDYVDIYQCHRFDAAVPLEETVRAMSDLVQQGKLLYWGVSQWSAAQIQAAVGIADQSGSYRPQSNQPIYNLLNRSLEIEVMQTCSDSGLGLLLFSPLSQGVLTGKYSGGAIPTDSRAADARLNSFMQKRLNPDTLGRVDRLKPLAKELGLSLAQMALAWTLRFPVVSSAIIGASRPEQILDNVGASGVTLPDEILRRIEAILETAPVDQYTGQPIAPLRSV